MWKVLFITWGVLGIRASPIFLAYEYIINNNTSNLSLFAFDPSSDFESTLVVNNSETYFNVALRSSECRKVLRQYVDKVIVKALHI